MYVIFMTMLLSGRQPGACHAYVDIIIIKRQPYISIFSAYVFIGFSKESLSAQSTVGTLTQLTDFVWRFNLITDDLIRSQRHYYINVRQGWWSWSYDHQVQYYALDILKKVNVVTVLLKTNTSSNLQYLTPLKTYFKDFLKFV